jgi:hypothetical protein
MSMSEQSSPAVPNKVISVIRKTYQQSDYRDQRYAVCGYGVAGTYNLAMYTRS